MLIFLESILFLATIFLVLYTFLKYAKSLFSPLAIYTYFFTLLYIGRQAVLMLDLDLPMPDDLFYFDYSGSRLYVLSMVFLWSLSFYCVFFFNISNSFLKFIIPTPPLDSHLDFSRLYYMALLFFAVILAIYFLLIATFGFDAGIISYEVRLGGFFSGFSFLLNINVFAAYYSATLYFHLKKVSPNKHQSFKRFLLFSSFFAISLSYLFADRDNLIFFFIYIGFCYCIFIRRNFIYAIPFLVVLLLYFLVLLQKIRLANWGFEKEYDSFVRQISQGLNLQYYDSFILLEHTLTNNLLDEKFYRLGYDFYLGLIGIIPRSLWPGKPEMVDPGIWFSNQFIIDADYGWPISVIGEWWFNFSFFGVIFGGILAGILYNTMNKYYSRLEVSPFTFMLVFLLCTRVFMLGYSVIFPMLYILNVIPLFIILKLITKKNYHA